MQGDVQGVCILCIPTGYSFLHSPVFLVSEITPAQKRNLVVLKFFPNTSIMLEQIHVFKTAL